MRHSTAWVSHPLLRPGVANLAPPPWLPAAACRRRVGLRRNALYLVRPDGYVALADREPSVSRLTRYRDEHLAGDRVEHAAPTARRIA